MNVTPILVSVLGVLAGLAAGLGAPFVTSLLGRRTSAWIEQHAISDRILDLWVTEEPLPDLLRLDVHGTRRRLLLLGCRLRDRTARDACLRLVHLASSSDVRDDELLDAWSEMIATVAACHRRLSAT